MGVVDVVVEGRTTDPYHPFPLTLADGSAQLPPARDGSADRADRTHAQARGWHGIAWLAGMALRWPIGFGRRRHLGLQMAADGVQG